MPQKNDAWLSMREAARHFGYSSSRSLRRRISQLRKRGQVIDTGHPPPKYAVRGQVEDAGGRIVLRWLHPRTVLLRADVSKRLLNPKKGKRVRVGDT